MIKIDMLWILILKVLKIQYINGILYCYEISFFQWICKKKVIQYYLSRKRYLGFDCIGSLVETSIVYYDQCNYIECEIKIYAQV